MALTKRLVKGQALTAAEHDANIDHLEQHPSGVLLQKDATNTGLFIDPASPTRGWDDLIGDIYFEVGSLNEPTFAAWNGNIKKRQFDVNDEFFVTLHINHDYAPGTDIYFHVHWSHNVLGLTTGDVTWIAEGTYAKAHNQAAFGTPISATLTEAASTTQRQHMTTEVQISNAGGTGGLLDTNSLEVDGILELRVYLSANTMDGGAKPFLHTADCHIQSTGAPTKNRTPGFYT